MEDFKFIFCPKCKQKRHDISDHFIKSDFEMKNSDILSIEIVDEKTKMNCCSSCGLYFWNDNICMK